MNGVRWIAIAFVLGLCAAYALWGSAPPPSPTSAPTAAHTPAATTTGPGPAVNTAILPRPDTTGLGKTAAALLKFDPASVDFGEVPVGSSKLEKISVRNVSGRILHIAWAKGSCGCMKADLASQDLPPNAAAEMKLTFTGVSGKRPESYHAEVYVEGLEMPANVDVRAKVLQLFEADPDKLQFDRIAKGESKTLPTTIRRLDGQPFNIINASVPGDYDEIAIARPVEVPGSNKSAYTIGVTVTGKRGARLLMQASAVTDVVIHQDKKDFPATIPINIFADIDGDAVALEKIVSTTLDAKGNLTPFVATIKRLNPGPLTVEKVDDSVGSTVSFIAKNIDDVTLKLTITMETSAKNRQPFGEFRIYTNTDKQPIRLPYNLPRRPGHGLGGE